MPRKRNWKVAKAKLGEKHPKKKKCMENAATLNNSDQSMENDDRKNHDQSIGDADLLKKRPQRMEDADLLKKRCQSTGDADLLKNSDQSMGDADLLNNSDQSMGDADLLNNSDQSMGDADLLKNSDQSMGDADLLKNSDQSMGDADLLKNSDQSTGDADLLKNSDQSTGDADLLKNSDQSCLLAPIEFANIRLRTQNDSANMCFWAPNDSASICLRAQRAYANNCFRAQKHSYRICSHAPNDSANVCLQTSSDSTNIFLQAQNYSNIYKIESATLSPNLRLQNHDETVASMSHEFDNLNQCSSSQAMVENYIESNIHKKNSSNQHITFPFNAVGVTYGSFHQNNDRFSDDSKGMQCVGNCLAMLAASQNNEVFTAECLDKILLTGDDLYKKISGDLKKRGMLLSAEDVPGQIKIDNVTYDVQKYSIVSGLAIDITSNPDVLTLHEALELAFSKTSMLLIFIGAMCSAAHVKNGKYHFFDSHSTDKNGLNSVDGTSILIYFEKVDDLVAYLYAFYQSKLIDITNQFDLLPLRLSCVSKIQPLGLLLDDLMKKYFDDQKRRKDIHKASAAEQSVERPLKNSNLQKLRRKMYHKEYMKQRRLNKSYRQIEARQKQNARMDDDFRKKEKQKELESKRISRQDDYFKEKEVESKRVCRKNVVFREKEKQQELESKRTSRKDDYFREKEVESKRFSRQNVLFKEKEVERKRISRQNVLFKEKEVERKRICRKNVVFREKEKQKERESKRISRQNVFFKEKEVESKRICRKNVVFREKEKQKELESKRTLRQDDYFREKEVQSKRISRQDVHFREKELEHKRVCRQHYYFKEKERLSKANHRKVNRESEKISDNNRKQLKRQSDAYREKEIQTVKKRKFGATLSECIEKFHSIVSVGPVFVCTCCQQSWFHRSVTNVAKIQKGIFSQQHRNYLTNYKSVKNQEWICHTCLDTLKAGKIPKLAVVNGMKWPEKIPELDLRPLEERLVSLRIPFMQIRELPRGGQFSLKGNIINVPVDVQPTINTLPRQMDNNFTIAVQLKKKMTYQKCDFKENVRPAAVLTALHWLINNSDFYRKSNIHVDESWIEDVTTSANEIVREFIGEKHENISLENSAEVEMSRSGYESDKFSEVDESDIVVANTDTMVDDANVSSNNTFTFAPGEGQHPLSLYHDKDSEFLCFPSIFCGINRTQEKNRSVPVHYSDIAKWELRSVDRRAAQSVPNIFFKMKKIQMKQISDKVNLALRKFKGKSRKLTAAEAKDPSHIDSLVRHDEGYYIFKQIRNSPAYLEAKKKDVFAMIRQLGLPTWFMSLSSADTRWVDLLKILAKLNDGVEITDADIQNMTWAEKTKLVQKDPVTSSRYFDHRVQEFLKNVLQSFHQPVGKVSDFFYRVEFQQRGSPHIHMLVWIDNAPKYEKHSDTDLINYVEQYITCAKDSHVGELVQLQTHKHSKTCRKKGKAICRFGFPLPPMSKTMLLRPLDENVEKYTKKYIKMQKRINEFKNDCTLSFEAFLNVIDMNEDEYIKVIRTSLSGPKIFLKRHPSEMRINPYNESILKAWRANLDIQFVLDPYACAMYIVSYISKSQRGMSSMLDAAAKEAREGNLDLKKQVRHIGNIFSNCVELSAQEAVYMVLQMPLTRCTRDVIFINTSAREERLFLLKPKSLLDELPPESTDVVSDNVIDKYAKRPRQLENWCLADYMSQLDVVYPKSDHSVESMQELNDDDIDNRKDNEDDTFSEADIILTLKNGIMIKRRKNAKVLRYVRFNVKTDPENHYREKLLLFMPWRNEEKDLKGEYTTFFEHYNSRKHMINNKCKQYEHYMEVLDEARHRAESEFNNYDQVAPNTEQIEAEDEEEGQIESSEFVYFNPDRAIEHRVYDIAIDIGATSSVPTVEPSGVRISDEKYMQLLQKLNVRQREFFNHVIQCVKTNQLPLFTFLAGGAGVGKSLLINALYQALHRLLNSKEGDNPDDIKILLCAYTGKAAHNINGVTISSAFKEKYLHPKDNQKLSCDELNSFRVKYKNLSVIIIDEISLVGNGTLNFINERLQALTGTKKTFGGISILTFGDLYQLKPVGDSWIFNDLKKGASALANNLWKDNFKIYELIEIMRQKDDMKFAQLLNRLRHNELTDDDRMEIKKRSISADSENYPKTALHVFTENKPMNDYNDSVLSGMNTQKTTIPCFDSLIESNIKKKQQERFIAGLPDNMNLTANLRKSLVVAIDMTYDVTVNLNVEDGLTNGSTCTAKLVEHKMQETSRPSIIWVLFADPKIGCLTRQKYRQKGFYNVNIHSDWTPIFDVQRSFRHQYKMYQRIQFPLTPSVAKTVHKSQGCTVDELVVDLSQSINNHNKNPHIHYVALSRVRTLDKLHILNFNEDKLRVDQTVEEEMQRLRIESKLELCYRPLYQIDSSKFKIAFNNVRSMHKHFIDVQKEPNILSADISSFAESRLCNRDSNDAYKIEGYDIIRNDQKCNASNTRPYHGIIMYIKTGIEKQITNIYSSTNLEFIFLKFSHPTKFSCQLISLYKSPKCSVKEYKTEMTTKLLPLVNINKPLIIMGDFNQDVAGSYSNGFIKFMRETFLCSQFIKKPTTDSGSMLDLIFSNISLNTDVIESYWSDHSIVYCAV